MSASRSSRRCRLIGRWAWLVGMLATGWVHCAEMSPAGTWHGWVRIPSGKTVGFDLEVAGVPAPAGQTGRPSLTGTLVNGDERVASTSVYFDGRSLLFHYDYLDATLMARVDGDRMEGIFVRQWETRTLSRELKMERSRTEIGLTESKVDLTGDWVLRVGEGANQRLWRAALRTSKGRAGGTIVTSGGDLGNFVGTWDATNRLTLGHFDGINARLFEAALQPDGTLAGMVDLGLTDPPRRVVAERMSDKNSELVARLPNPQTQTRMIDPGQPFKFRFPNLDGSMLGWDDGRFRNKVVLISITGSWCPNCHEEMPFLQELYDRYHAQGLEMVGLAFEYTGDAVRDGKQVGTFVRRHGLKFPVLLAGSTDDAAKKLPQLANFGAFPTTIYVGRDGLVKRIHAGFEGSATGDRFVRLKSEIEAEVKELLTGPEKGR